MLPYQTNVSSKYGAPMGRNIRDPHLLGKVSLRRVRLDQGGYDQGGAYWGHGQPLFCAWNDENPPVYVRATDRDTAKADLARMYEVTFYR